MDASKFSLDEAAKTIRPHIEYLPFRRLSDLVGDLKFERQVPLLQHRLQLWPAHTRLPADLDQDWKAHAVAVDIEMYGHDGSENQPIRIKVKRILLMTPSNDSILWAFQECVFVKERMTRTFYSGVSEIYSVTDDNLRRYIDPSVRVSSHFWDSIAEWVDQTVRTRQEAVSFLEELGTQTKLMERTIHPLVRSSTQFVG